MKKLIVFNILIFLALVLGAQERLIFNENFDGSTKPSGWSEEKVVGVGGTSEGSIVSWQYTNGGYYDYPEYPYQGNRNAMFQLESEFGETTKLITPAIDLSDVSKPELRFAHVQQIWENEGTDYWDRLKVYYKRGVDSSWVLLEAYENAVANWVDRSILLPDSSKSSTYYIAFEGITGFGYGSCIDTMRVVETGIEAKYLDSYSINQAATNFIPTNTFKNQILYINFNVKGNDGHLFLDSLKVTSLNTDDDNISNNGVKLYATSDSVFKDPVLIASGINFTDGIAYFKNIGYDLPRGKSTVWITYDIASATDHDIHNNIADAKIEEEGIYINGYAYPFSDKSPEGKRLIKEALFNDSFETDLAWTFNNSFERAIPLGLGESFPGNSDPDSAYNGSYIIGTDLTTDGAYSNDLTNRQDSAISPNFDCLYYKDVTLYFARWLNVEYWDKVYIDISTDNKNSWTQYWTNTGAILDDSWSAKSYDLDDADFKENVSIMFSLGSTNDVNQYTGWNIDDFIIIGDFISNDVGITGIMLPETGCGHTSSDEVRVYIENYAGEITNDTILLRFSVDGSTNYTIDTLFSSIAIGDSALFTFSLGADLSTPGYHTVNVKTLLSGDEIPSNDSKSITIFSYPTISLPYSENFETNNGYYLPGGTNSSWEYGEPSGSIINSAASGVNAWLTNLDGSYSSNDSSFIESPCFNFAGTDSIVFEFKCKGLSEDKTDGLTLLYSTDEGTTWNIVPDNEDFYWNWYNETLISELELPGIDTTNGEWLTFRQLLPPVLSNQSSVKFRFVFESDVSTNEEGFGIDDIKIYKAPYDVGVTSLNYPFDRCEWSDTTHVKVYVENYGITDVVASTKIPLKLNFNSEIINDTLTLANDLVVEDSVLFIFNSTVDMSYAGDFDFTINTDLESNTYFYNDTLSNDTLYATASVTGMPNYDIGWIVGSDDLDTLLDAQAGYNPYSWYFGGSEVGTSQTYRATAEGIYYVTVTNAASCTANDSLKVVPSLVDVTMDSIRNAPVNTCERFELTEITASISNTGQNLIDEVNDTIPFGYQVNDLSEVLDTLFLDGRNLTKTPPNDTISFTFSQKCDLTEPGEYTISVFTNFTDDLNRTDDTITTTINTWGLPDVNLAYDTIYSSQADTLTLDAGEGFASYIWNSGSAVQTETPSNSSYYYKVTVTDVHACSSDKDSTYIETHDLGISAVTSPLNICEDLASATTSLNVDVVNYSDNIYSSSSVKIFYKYDNNDWLEVNPVLNIGASDTVTLSSIATIDATSIGEHTLKLHTSSDIDANNTNDTLVYKFETWANPHVDLAYDTIFTTQADTVVLVAQDGFASYAWSDGTTINDSLIVTDNFSAKYIVTVADEHACGSDKDSTQIITYNLGINEFVAPESDCEHTNSENVIVSVKNYSQDVLSAGTVIPVGYILEGKAPVEQNYTLLSDLNPSGTVNVTFAVKVNVEEIKTHKFKLYTAFDLDVVASNDTLVDAIKTFGYPVVDLGNDIYTTEPDSVILTAPAGYNNYIWNDGTNTNTLSVTYTASKLYSVTVTNINGCATTDDINVYTYDVGISSINTPVTKCEFGAAEVLDVSVLNNSKDTLLTDETINLTYSLNGGTGVNEVFTLLSDLLPDSTADYSFTSTLDLTSASSHNIKLTSSRTIDVNDINDTLSVNIKAVGYPSFTLGDDIYTTSPVGTVLTTDPGGFDSYLWQDGSTNNTFTVSYTASKQYSVTVTDIYGCSTPDTIEVYTYDVGISSINTPVTTCEFGAAEVLNVSVINNSKDTLLADETINLTYSLNGGTGLNEVFTLLSDLLPDATADYSFTSTLDLTSASSHNIKLTCSRTIDVNDINDTLSVNINEVGYPIFTLGDDIYTTSPVGTVLTTNPGGFDSYLWQDGSTSSTFTISHTASAQYSVTVADSYGCESSDTVEVYTYNIAADSLAAPISKCELSSTETVKIGVINTSEDTLQIGEALDVGFKLNSGSLVSEAFTLTKIMYPDSIEFFTLTSTADLSLNQLHEFKLFAKLTNIDVLLTDTTTVNVDYLKPNFDLGANIIVALSEDTIIDAGSGYASYEWFDATDEQTYTVEINEQTPNHYYAVTVTTNDGCEASDSLMVTFDITQDLGVTKLLSPASECWKSEKTYQVQITIQNLGAINIASGTPLDIGYTIDDGTPVVEDTALISTMNADDTFDYTFANEITFGAAKIYEFKPFVKLGGDEDVANDTLLTSNTVNISQPDVDLGSDTVKFESTYEITTTGNYADYIWSTGDADDGKSSIVITETGTYSVTVTDGNGCEGSDSIYCEKLTGIDNLIQGNGYSITYYPNPVADELKIDIVNSESKDLYLELINIQGQIIFNRKYTKIQNTVESIDVNPYANGVYYIRFRVDNKFYMRKIIIQ